MAKKTTRKSTKRAKSSRSARKTSRASSKTKSIKKDTPSESLVIKYVRNFIKRMIGNMFAKKKNIKLGIYGPPNAGKTTLANRVCQDWLGKRMGSVSKKSIPNTTSTLVVTRVNILNFITYRH